MEQAEMGPERLSGRVSQGCSCPHRSSEEKPWELLPFLSVVFFWQENDSTLLQIMVLGIKFYRTGLRERAVGGGKLFSAGQISAWPLSDFSHQKQAASAAEPGGLLRRKWYNPQIPCQPSCCSCVNTSERHFLHPRAPTCPASDESFTSQGAGMGAERPGGPHVALTLTACSSVFPKRRLT